MKSIGLSLLSLVFLGASARLYGQEIRGSIVGNVTDSSGAAVSGPSITQSTDYIMSLVLGMSVAIPFGNSNPDIGGAPYTGSSNWTVNGISTNNPGQGGGGNVTYVGSDEMIAQANLPSIGTLQEFKVDASVVGAEYRSQVAVSMVTQQGSNQVHREGYGYNEKKTLRANYFDLNAQNEKGNTFKR